MSRAVQYGTLAAEQYGSRPDHQAITLGWNKRLTMDLSRLLALPLAFSSIDAMSCYDRIGHPTASMAMKRQGAPPQAVHSMLRTLQTATHRIRTAFGVSKKGFGPEKPPLGGVGQGNGGGPTIWACISDTLIEMLRTAGCGLKRFSAITGRLISFVCYAFVDDTDKNTRMLQRLYLLIKPVHIKPTR